MTNWQSIPVAGWGHTTVHTVPTGRPGGSASVADLLGENSNAPILPFGLCRSYGDVSVPTAQGRGLLLTHLNKFLAFNPQSGLLVAEAGATLADMLHTFLPQGWMIPVTPGTYFVTLGGAIANDVHGKNHRTAGSFGNHVEWIDLMLADGREARLSAQENAPLFHATIGGLGLTGVILRAAIRLMPVPGNTIAITRHRVEDLDHVFASYLQQPAEDPFAVTWIDAMARGGSMGRGIFERGHITAERIDYKPRFTPGLPCNFPNFALNPLSIGLFNTFRYYTAASSKPKVHLMPVEAFFYPLDSIHNWNRMYGRRGFHQFQAVIPEESAQQGIRLLLEEISRSRKASFLAVLKRLGATGQGLLSFPLPGFTLALDFPNSSGVSELLARLIRITRDYGGRVYLAKDSALTADDFCAMYPLHEQYRAILEQVDPQQRFSSAMAVRLGLKRGAA